MFTGSAEAYDAIYRGFKDFETEAAAVAAVIRSRHPSVQTVLDVGARRLRSRAGALLTSCALFGVGCGSAASHGDSNTDGGDSSDGAGADAAPPFASFPDNVDSLPPGPAELGDPMQWAEHNNWVAPSSPDDRPEPPPWDLDEGLGDPGWRESTTPICFDWAGYANFFSIWADTTGVYALYGSHCSGIRLAGPGDLGACSKFGWGAPGMIQYNDGNGWNTLALMSVAVSLSGFPGGRRFVVGGCGALDSEGLSNGLTFVDFSGKVQCEVGGSWGDGSKFIGLGTGTGLVFPGRESSAVWLFDAGEWSDFGAALYGGAFASKNLAIATGAEQYIAMRSRLQANFERLADVPVGTYVAAWASSPDDVWALNGGGELVHFNGADWHKKAHLSGQGDSDDSQLWGDGQGNIYYRTISHFGRWSPQKGEQVLVDFSNSRRIISGFAPVSPSEMFVGVFDSEAQQYRCGGSVVLWFDGTEFHRF